MQVFSHVGHGEKGGDGVDVQRREANLQLLDKARIVMIGNNLKKDIAGANRQGLISIWLDWSPRYFHTAEEPDWEPDYTVKPPRRG